MRAEQRAPGGYEMDVEGAEIVQRIPESDPYPITPKEHGVDFLMDHRHLWLRSKRQHAAIRVRHEVIRAVRDYFDTHGFTLVDTPIFTPAACEGTSTLFEVNYFEDEKAYLTQSGQLYNEADAMAFGKVYCFGPTFRAEKSKTRRHLTEFWMVEPEMAYATLEDVKRVGEEMVVYVVGRVLENRRAELADLERDTSKLESVQSPFPRMSYDDAVVALQKKGSEIQWGGDFGNTDETLITEGLDRPLIVDRFPTEIKAFYFEPDPERPEAGAGRGFHRARRLWRDYRRRPAHSQSGFAVEAFGRAQASARSFRLVRGSAQVRQRAACGFRDGYRALRGVDVRAGAYSRDDRFSPDAVSHASVEMLKDMSRGARTPECRVETLLDTFRGESIRRHE